MRRVAISLLVIAALQGCDQWTPPPEKYAGFDAEYFRKRKVCDERPDPVLPSSFDNEPLPVEPKRPVKWRAQFTYLGDTCYTAAIGGLYYSDKVNETPGYYSIDVEARKTETDGNGKRIGAAEVVLFQRSFESTELPKGFEKQLIRDVVHFDEQRQVVQFDIGTHAYRYQLPRP